MEHVNGWCFRGVYKGGLWEDDLHVSALMPTDDRKMTYTLKINNTQHFKCALLDFYSNLGRVSLNRAFFVLFFVLESSAEDFCFVRVDLKQNIQPVTDGENA